VMWALLPTCVHNKAHIVKSLLQQIEQNT